MKISTTTQYGLMAVGYIARNSNGPKDTVLAKRIATEYGIAWEYLLKVLQQLARANVLRSKRGPHGGFSLARPPKKINLLQIIEAVEGPMISGLNLEENAKGEKFCKRVEQTYEKAIAQAKNVFKKATRSDLVE